MTVSPTALGGGGTVGGGTAGLAGLAGLKTISGTSTHVGETVMLLASPCRPY